MLANEIVVSLCLWRRPACEKAEAELGPKKGEVWQPASPDGEVSPAEGLGPENRGCQPVGHGPFVCHMSEIPYIRFSHYDS